MRNLFVPLHTVSNYSLLYGGNHISELVKTASNAGFTALALTDINNFYGAHIFLEECYNHGIKPILGSRLQIKNSYFIALAKNYSGYSNISQAISQINTSEKATKILELVNYLDSDNIIIIDSASLLSRIFNTQDALYIKQNMPKIYAGVKNRNIRIVKMATEFKLPIVALPEIIFIEPKDYKTHKLLRAIDLNTGLKNLSPSETASSTAFFPSLSNLETLFTSSAIINSMEIAKQCNTELFHGFIFPKWKPPKQLHNKNNDEILRIKAIEGAESRYGTLSETVISRLDYELDIIRQKGFSDYFLTVMDIVKNATRICGRGSGAASLVAYSLGITNVDPIRHNLYFERFLNLERVDPPDIDIDFAWDERDEIIKEVMESYGTEYSAMVCNHIHFKPRSALRETAKVYGLPDGEIKIMRRKLSQFHKQAKGMPFSDKFYKIGNSITGLPAPWPEIIEQATRITGFPRHLGVHSGGIILTPKPIAGYVPIEIATKGVPVITWEKDGTEEAGFIKIDLLGNRSLAVVRDAIINIKKNGILFEQEQWNPLDDKETIALLARGDSMGVFYVESPAMRQLQKKTRKGDFEHLVIHSSIIRPAANRFISQYVRRLKGEKYKPLHPLLENILHETYGIMVYQEDVSRVARSLAGFSAGDADGLRKILSKKNKGVKLIKYKEQFFEGARKNGVKESTISEIWKMILSFDGYSFCKPHSASYAMVSFQSAYIKAHYPAEFIASVISNQGGFYTPLAYISEAKRLGVSITGPDINQSEFKYTGAGKVLTVGFMAISGVRKESIDLILTERQQNGKFSSLNNFIERVNIIDSDIETFISIGLFDSISKNLTRPQQLWKFLLQSQGGSEYTDETALLFSSNFSSPKNRDNSDIPVSKPLATKVKQQELYTNMGFLPNGHPLDMYEEQLKNQKNLIKARDLKKYEGKHIAVAGWPVTRRTVLTSSGELMQFVGFEDKTAIYETILFPEINEKYGDSVKEIRPFIIRGKVENDLGAIYLQVESVKKLNRPPTQNRDAPNHLG